MNIARHRMPRELFGRLARGEGGADAVRELAAAQYSKHLILLRGVREAARPDDRFAVRGYELLAEVQRHDPAAAEFVIGHPSVGAWALRTLRGIHPPPGAEPGGMSAVAAAAAITAGLPAEIEVRVTGGRVVLPALGAAEADGRTAVVRTRPAEVRSAGRRVPVSRVRPAGRRVPVSQPAAGWQGLRPIRAGQFSAVFDDVDPFRMPSAEDLAPRLSADEFDEWSVALRDAWTVLAPVAATEVAAMVRVIVPQASPPAGHVSSSAAENFGAVAMSRQPDRYTCAETLVHEVQHLKLSALLDLVTLTLPDDGRRFYAPWRADPRPAGSLLQGAYAFLGVSRFWRQQRQAVADDTIRKRADAEFARWRAAAARATRTLLSSGRLTRAGQDFVLEMTRVLDAWQREPVPAAALAVARREAERHLARWQADNGPVPA